MIKYFNDTNFNGEQIDSNCVLYFYSEQCRPCRTASSEVSAAAEAMPQVTVGKIETSTSSVLCDKFNVRHVPTVVFVKDGKEVSRLDGKIKKDEIEKIYLNSVVE